MDDLKASYAAKYANAKRLQLHLGGWEVKEGWIIVNVEDREGVDVRSTVTDLSMFPDGSAVEIYASHVYEHLGYQEELPKAFEEARRVLMPGGRGGFVVLRGLRDPLVAGIPRVASVAVLEDEDRFTVYDRYGRPIAMPEGEVFSVEDRLSDRPGTVEVYRDGDHVVAVHAQSREFARRIVAALQQAAARREARGGGRARRAEDSPTGDSPSEDPPSEDSPSEDSAS